MNSEYLVLLPVEPFRRFDSYPAGKSLPLHCTVMHWFRIRSAASYVALNKKLALLASKVDAGAIELVSHEPALFGPNNDVPVHVLQRNERLNLLHTEILLFLALIKSVPEERRWVGAGYRHHVTSTDKAFGPGQKYVPKHLVLVERGEDKNKIVSIAYWLGGAPS
jgi:hypothetical protein